jgi:hypothetical protein
VSNSIAVSARICPTATRGGRSNAICLGCGGMR